MRTLIKNIKGLVQARESIQKWVAGKDMAHLPVIENSYLILDEGKISDYGPMENLSVDSYDMTIDAAGKFVFPSYVDSHSHIVFAANREGEFVDRIKGLTYEEIAAKGGGILNSAKVLQDTSEDELYESALKRIHEVIKMGTGALEIKSGYGLTVEDELKMLRVAKRLKEETPLTIKTTFLGAHAIPKSYSNRRDYINLVISEMIPAVAEANLAEYCDVFCEEGFFTYDEAIEILEVGKKHGLKPKVHANQLNLSGGVQAGVSTNAISVDHLEQMGDEEIACLAGTDTMPTFLPGAAFFLSAGYPPARKMIDHGLPVALATDYNPGSSPSGNMNLMVSLACIKMGMTPAEAFNAATINSAYAMEVADKLGTITKGKIANIFITKEIPSLEFIPYSFGSNLVESVILNGNLISD